MNTGSPATTAAQSYDPTSKEFIEQDCEVCNSAEGKLKGYDCPKCKNKGVIYRPKFSDFYGYWTTVAVTCECMPIREELLRREKSGLKKLFNKYTFENYKHTEQWQRLIWTAAHAYVNNTERWFYIGGQPGCGKTHICTAIVNELIKKGRAARYMIWQDDITNIKQHINEAEIYEALINPLKKAEVLYIDDFFKVGKGAQVTAADVNATFKIINYRYNEDLPTIISSELSVGQIMKIDEALGSRIAEMTKGEELFVSGNPERNYRTRRRK